MPNQTDPNSNPPTAQTPAQPFVTNVPTQTESAPPPPDFQSISSEESVAPPIGQFPNQATVSSTSPVIPTDSPPITTSPPKKKFGGGKIIATILGILLLVGGVGTGVLLTQQKQLVPQQAQTLPTPPGGENPTPKSGGTNPDLCGVGSFTTSGGFRYCFVIQDSGVGNLAQARAACKPYGSLASMLDGETKKDLLGITAETKKDAPDFLAILKVPPPPPGHQFGDQVGPLVADSCKDFVKKFGNNQPDLYSATEKQLGYIDCSAPDMGPNLEDQVPYSRVGLWNDGYDKGNKGAICEIGQASPPPGGTPTPPPGPTAQCLSVKAYSGANYVLLTPESMSMVKPGDPLHFCVNGSASSGSFDQAKFTINGVVQAETTLVRPGSTDYCQAYTVPDGVTTFNVTAQIHHVTLGWIGP